MKTQTKTFAVERELGPDHGMTAPEFVRRFGFYGIGFFILSVLLQIFLPPGWISLVILVITFGLTFSFLLPAIAISINSHFLKFKDRE